MSDAGAVVIEPVEWAVYVGGVFAGTVRYDGRAEEPRTPEGIPSRPDPWSVLWYPSAGQEFVHLEAPSPVAGLDLLAALTRVAGMYDGDRQ